MDGIQKQLSNPNISLEQKGNLMREYGQASRALSYLRGYVPRDQ